MKPLLEGEQRRGLRRTKYAFTRQENGTVECVVTSWNPGYFDMDNSITRQRTETHMLLWDDVDVTVRGFMAETDATAVEYTVETAWNDVDERDRVPLHPSRARAVAP